MTKKEIEDRLAKLEKTIGWLKWATGTSGQLHWEVAVNYDLHREQLEEAKAEQAQLKHMLASLS